MNILKKGGTPSASGGSVHGGDATYAAKYKGAVGLSLPSSTSSSHWNTSSTSLMSERPPGVVGLTNIGNTCFMNSGIQCLLHTSRLVEFFLKLNISQERSIPSSLGVVASFQEVMKHAWFGISKIIDLSNLRSKLGEIHPQFKDGRQHDCQEFLTLMLDTLQEQLKSQQNRYSNPITMNGYHSEKDSVSSTGDDYKINSKRCGSDTHKKTGVKRPKLEGAHGNGRGYENMSDENVESALEREAKRAEDYWSDWVSKNDTIISSTFQGLFKSTVVCEECSYVSVTYEPFMYLTVPIPRVSTKNICVTFVNMRDQRPLKVHVTLMLDATVERLKEFVAKEVPGLSNDPSTLQDCVIVEIVNNNIARKLNEDMQVSYINDSSRNVYMYELNDNFTAKHGRMTNMFTLTGIFSNNSQSQTKPFLNTFDENWDNSPPPAQEPPNLIINDAPDTTTSPIPSPIYGPVQCPTSTEGEAEADTTTGESEKMETEESSSSVPELILAEEVDTGEPKLTCIICLEDFPISSCQILQHRLCPALLCRGCVHRAAEFYENNDGKNSGACNGSHLKCPTCAVAVASDSFTGFPHGEPISELNLVAVLLRLPLDSNNNTTKTSGRLFGAPFVVRIPYSLPAEELHPFIAEINPFPELEYSLVNVLYDGIRCATCLASSALSECDGCEVQREGIVSIPPGTALAISYLAISTEQIASVEPEDMATIPISTPTFVAPEPDPVFDIHDSLRSFSEVEHLDEQNPWHCPQCKKDQRATKTITICRFPDCLIIQLKRFVFIENMSCKLNNKLRFPLTDLDMNPYISQEFEGKANNIYDLYSCVCHYGSTTSGHYTAYSKNPVSHKWHYFNDGMVNVQMPSEAEFSNAYVLFFQRKGLRFDIPKRTEETIIRTPIVTFSRPIAPAAIVVPPPCNTNADDSNLGKEDSIANAWNSIPTSIPDSSLVTTIEPSPCQEMNFRSGKTTFINYPHVSSSSMLDSTLSSTTGGGFMAPDDGYAEDYYESSENEQLGNDPVSQSDFPEDLLELRGNIPRPTDSWRTMD